MGFVEIFTCSFFTLIIMGYFAVREVNNDY